MQEANTEYISFDGISYVVIQHSKVCSSLCRQRERRGLQIRFETFLQLCEGFVLLSPAMTVKCMLTVNGQFKSAILCKLFGPFFAPLAKDSPHGWTRLACAFVGFQAA